MIAAAGEARAVRGLARPPYFSLALASSAALAYEILLTRLFAIIQWHHFAYLVISLALLGYGLSGTVLAFARARLIGRVERSYPACLALFALAMPLCYLLAQSVSVHPEAILWRPLLMWKLSLVYLCLAVPFFFVALAVAILLARYRVLAGSVYAADLAGAGLGSIAVILALFWLLPEHVLWALSSVGAIAALTALAELQHRNFPTLLLIALVLALPLLIPAEHLRLKLSPYKALSQTLAVSGAELLQTRSSPQGLISVVANSVVPFRHAPGLSLNSRTGPPEQMGVFTDGEAFTPVNQWPDTRRDAAWLDASTQALPYHLLDPESILITDAGGGTEVLRALLVGRDTIQPRKVDALESNPQLAKLVLQDYAAFAGDLYARPGVRIFNREPREFLAAHSTSYDLITLPPPGGPGGTGGLSALTENYRFTREAFSEYLDHIHEAGFLVVTSWVQLPPRDTLKVLATAVAALAEAGVGEPSARLILVRGWQTATLLVKGSDISAEDRRRTAEFCRQRGFDLVFYPGMQAEEANRFNRLPRAAFHEAAVALAGSAASEFAARYKFSITPATDDRPYFFQFFRWRSLGEFVSLRERGGLGLLESGLVILLATLLQALVFAFLLVLLPLMIMERADREKELPWRGRVFAYFSLLGLAFMFIEIAFIQKFLQLLQHPVYSVTVVLGGFLVFAGIGSAMSASVQSRFRRHALHGVIAGIVLLGLIYLAVLPGLHMALAGAALPWRMAVALGLVAPLAFLMGMPFPLGIMRLSEAAERAVPWAWAINGSASVVSAVLAMVVAMHWGFSMVVLWALAMYMLCVSVAPRPGLGVAVGGGR